MTKKELAEKLNGRQYGDGFEDVLKEAKQSGLVIVTGASDDLMEFEMVIRGASGCFDGEVYLSRSDGDQGGANNWINVKWCNAVNRNGLRKSQSYETFVSCERFYIFKGQDIYCEGLVFSVEDLK